MSEPLFSKCDLAAALQHQIAKAQTEIDECKDDYLLNVSETDFAKYLASKCRVQPIQLGEPFMLDPREVDVDIGNNPFWGASLHGRTHVKGHRVEIHIPFTGEPELFWCRPVTYTFSPPCAHVLKGI